MNRKQRIHAISAAALCIAILVMLIVSFADRGLREGYGQYDDARLRFLASKSGTVGMQIHVTSTLMGPTEFYRRESTYAETREDILSYTLASAQIGDRRYENCEFYDTVHYYRSMGGGWFVHPPAYYRDVYDKDPFYDIGPAIDKAHVTSVDKVDNSDTVVYTFTLSDSAPPVSYPMLFFDVSQFTEQSAVVTLDRKGQLCEIRRLGLLEWREGSTAESFTVEIIYRFESLGEAVEIARPQGL